ncbi:acyltransferase-domain-containing protein [Ephemerocybe angulata]|uniref:Acyltransferase-domain-containing protein n=1 Tax=Ephemerocybe angulata TaxID=980116 RepID=A0A8H6IKV3_9AGAR|nr:acyltransferase-domain-containing protein [Tulosesus angulatus]
MCQWFAPTKLVVTFERDGIGKFTDEDIAKYVVRDDNGEAVGLDLPTKFVLIANHQIYADWWYAWCFTYFLSPKGVHRYVYITLKKSLRWVPIVGWGMQFFNFIFLARSWASDRVQLAADLTRLGRAAEDEHRPFCFLLYPEGTLISQGTRPISKKFADKIGVDDLKHMLLPRSTGLHYSLRSLSPRIPSLKLLDMTVHYPGIPPMGYGQSYYTLRSIFMQGVPPPEIHIHLRMLDVKGAVPIGNLSSLRPSTTGTKKKGVVEVEIPSGEKDEFDAWLRRLWQEKDESMGRFHETGSFTAKASSSPHVDIPVQLHRKTEILDAFCFFWPAALAYSWKRLKVA